MTFCFQWVSPVSELLSVFPSPFLNNMLTLQGLDFLFIYLTVEKMSLALTLLPSFYHSDVNIRRARYYVCVIVTASPVLCCGCFLCITFWCFWSQWLPLFHLLVTLWRRAPVTPSAGAVGMSQCAPAHDGWLTGPGFCSGRRGFSSCRSSLVGLLGSVLQSVLAPPPEACFLAAGSPCL